MASERCGRCSSFLRVETALYVLIALLCGWGIFVQIWVRHVVHEERHFEESHAERVASELAEIEHELVDNFEAPEEAEVWTPQSEEAAEADARHDPNAMDAKGEFSVPKLARGGGEVLLATRLLFPVTQDSWCELKLTATVPSGAYKLSMSGALGRWGAHASGGLPLLQVRVREGWQLLLGSPKRKSEDLEAPLDFNFSVPYGFSGVRLKASTWHTFNSGGRLSLARMGEALPAEPLPQQPPSRYLVLELDRDGHEGASGHASSLLSLFNGLGLALLLNVSLVLPLFATRADDKGRPHAHGASTEVDFGYFYDTEAFIGELSPLVSVVRQLPRELLAFMRQEQKQTADFVNARLGASSRELERYVSHLEVHNVLWLSATARTLLWNTPELVRLRVLLHSALRPVGRVSAYTEYVRAGIESFAARKKLSPAFVGLQMPDGEDWHAYCRRQEVERVTVPLSDEMDARRCILDAKEVATALEERQVGQLSKILYVVQGGALNTSQLQALFELRFVVISRSRFMLEMQPDIAEAVDLQVSRLSALFVGNAYSPFSYLLRESKLVAGESERAIYYNMHTEATLGDLTAEEALRWDVMPLGLADSDSLASSSSSRKDEV